MLGSTGVFEGVSHSEELSQNGLSTFSNEELCRVHKIWTKYFISFHIALNMTLL